MRPGFWSFILLISLTHALVHTYELAWPSIEQEATAEFLPGEPLEAKSVSGWLAGTWRLLFGGGSLVVGFFVVRRTAVTWLVVYLVGCAIASVFAAASGSLTLLAVSLAGMGAFASIYHPAGLGLISAETDPETRPQALGVHGILGSLGIAVAPFLAAVWLACGGTWRGYLALLAVPGVMLAVALVWSQRRAVPMLEREEVEGEAESSSGVGSVWMLLLIGSIAAVQGFVYSAQLSFLPRYLSRDGVVSVVGGARSSAESESGWSEVSGADEGASRLESRNVRGKLLAGIALVIGCLGQYLSGRMARHRWLEWQLTGVLLANVPFLVAMGFATGPLRVVAAGGFALVHFMYQPVYNSLIAKRIGGRGRSLAYGASFAVSLGLGSLGAVFASRFQSDLHLYSSLALFTLVGVVSSGVLAGGRGFLASRPLV